jgi:hypothetical protein
LPDDWLLTIEGLHVPVIPLMDVVGKTGTASPAQIAALIEELKTGVLLVLTVTSNVVIVAHWPVPGVNVYVPEFWLFITDGLHVPFIPLVEVGGNDGTVAPAQIVNPDPILKVGIVFGVTVTVKLVGAAHDPAVGVNVYIPEFWLSTVAGLHVPVMLLVDVFGNKGTIPPAQIVVLVPKLNDGIAFGITVMVIVVATAHWPPVGVNV